MAKRGLPLGRRPQRQDPERAVRVQISSRPSVTAALDDFAQRKGISRSAAIAQFVLAGIEREAAEAARSGVNQPV
jgi:metal-responsive CopG/Arc/MetJ family transcriptional regulator